MTFFNKKEEVMEIQLTQYGKYLLSKGKFKPVYYSFSDDEVLYDPSYGVEEGEEALETQERIQNETVRIRPIYEHDGAETRVLKLNGHIIVDRPDETQGTRTGFSHQVPFDNIYGSDTIDSISMEPDDRHLMRNLLGTSQLGNQNIPSWSIKSLNEQEFEHPIHLSSSGPDIGINRPRITMNIDYNLYSHQLREGEMENLQDLELDYQTGIDNDVFFLDRHRLVIENGKILLDVKEDNVAFEKENFDIEFFEILNPYEQDKEEILKRLFFKEESQDFIESEDVIETYFEILFDDQIPTTLDLEKEQRTFYEFDADDEEEVCD